VPGNATRKSLARRAFLLTIGSAIALLLADVTVASAKSLLDSVLNVVMGGDLLPSKDARMVATQSDDVLHFVFEYYGSQRRSVTVNRIGLCVFEVDSRGPFVAADVYRVDLSQAEFDKIRLVDNRNMYGHQTRVLWIPGAKFCSGLEESIPLCVIHSPGTCFCPGSAQGRRLMGFMRGTGRPICGQRDRIVGCVDNSCDGLA
jgi:hypothetical protein